MKRRTGIFRKVLVRGRSQHKGENIEDYFWGLSNHSYAGVVQMDRVSAFQAEDAGSSPVTCSRQLVYSNNSTGQSTTLTRWKL